MSQVCNKCGTDKDEQDYYKRDGCVLFKQCKQCVQANVPKKPKAPNGWQKLPLETRTAVMDQMKDRRLTVQKIAAKHNINYPNLCYWIRAGHCI